MKKKKRSIAGIRALFLLSLFSCYYISNNFFFHTHYQDGKSIVHSHPYSSANHTHSSNVFSLLSMYNHMLLVKADAVYFQPQELQVIYEFFAVDLQKYDSVDVVSLDPRGPPCIA